MHTPILTSNDCEGAGEQFEVITPKPPTQNQNQTQNQPQNSTQSTTSATTPATTPTQSTTPPTHFFGTPAYLTVSGQLQAEIYATSLSRYHFTYTHSTHRHSVHTSSTYPLTKFFVKSTKHF